MSLRLFLCVPLASRPDLRPRNEDDRDAKKRYVAAHENKTVGEVRATGQRPIGERVQAAQSRTEVVLERAIASAAITARRTTRGS